MSKQYRLDIGKPLIRITMGGEFAWVYFTTKSRESNFLSLLCDDGFYYVGLIDGELWKSIWKKTL